MTSLKYLFRLLLLLAVAAVGFTVFSVWLVHRSGAGRIVDNPARLPVNDVGLVLGTSKHAVGSRIDNLHFTRRLKAAAALFRAGRVRHLILSGNNDGQGYNEPVDMKNSLLALGVPAWAITLDGAGFRTLDSLVRAREVYGQKRLTIITDRFHCYRAMFLARHCGLDAVAFPCAEVDLASSLRVRGREILADVKACLDLYVLHTRPKQLGKPVAVHVAGR